MKCIGCEKESKDGLCKRCEGNLNYLEKVLNENNIYLQLESVSIKK